MYGWGLLSFAGTGFKTIIARSPFTCVAVYIAAGCGGPEFRGLPAPIRSWPIVHEMGPLGACLVAVVPRHRSALLVFVDADFRSASGEGATSGHVRPVNVIDVAGAVVAFAGMLSCLFHIGILSASEFSW